MSAPAAGGRSDLLLGLHPGHDSNVAVLARDGSIELAIGEERLNRIKQFPGFPALSLELARRRFEGRLGALVTVRLSAWRRVARELALVANSRRKKLAGPSFARLARVYAAKAFGGRSLERQGRAGGLASLEDLPLQHVEHHLAHAASAFHHSGFERATVMTLDGEGDGFSGGFYEADRRGLRRTIGFFHNEVTVGRDYEKVTAMLGYHPTRHPGKITGLAAFGRLDEGCIEKLSGILARSWRDARTGGEASHHVYLLIADEGRRELAEIRRRQLGEYDDATLACAIQELTERRVLALIRAHGRPGPGNSICLAGGVFANVKLNKKIHEAGYDRIFIQPAMSDQGLAVGAALHVLGQAGRLRPRPLEHVFFGPSYTGDEIKAALDRAGLRYRGFSDRPAEIAELLARGRVVAHFHGAMEFGPRALGHRSILYQTTDPAVNDWLNKRLKRTEFMPFAPVTLAEHAAGCYLGLAGAEHTARFMTITFDCSESMKRASPAVVHADGTARPQLVRRQDSPAYYDILAAYHRLTGIPSLVNTSFNMHEEPIVCSPDDAIRAWSQGHLDVLAIGPYLVEAKPESQ